MSPVMTVSERLAELLRADLSGLEVDIPVATMLSGRPRPALLAPQATAVVVRAALTGQIHEPLANFRLSISARLTVRLCDDADGAAFAAAHERMWDELLRLATGDGCEDLGGRSFAVDGLSLGAGEEPSLDASAPGGGAWACGFSATITGRTLKEN